MEDLISFGYWVRRQRLALDLTQAALAQSVGCATVTIKKIEQDERRPSRQLAELLAASLAIPAEQQLTFLQMARGEWPQGVGPPRIGQLPAFMRGGEEPNKQTSLNFVARERELRQLDVHLGQALAWNGRVVFVTGETGRGKTSLLAQFAHQAQHAHADLVVAAGNGNAFSGAGDPYLPFRDVLGMLSGDLDTRWAAGAITREQARRLWASSRYTIRTLTGEGRDLIDVLVPAAALVRRLGSADIGGSDWQESLRQRIEQHHTSPADLDQRQIFEAYTNVMQTLSARQPLLLLLDDLQWADSASISLLFHLGRRLSGSRILILGAYRPSEVAVGQGPIEPGDILQPPLELVVNEFMRDFGDIVIDLSDVQPEEGRAFVDALLDTQSNRLGESFRAKLFSRTGGHALFTVELLHHMQERGDLFQDEEGQWVEGPDLNWDAVPARVEAVIAQRMGRLPHELRDILSVASVEGEEFTAEVVARVRATDEWRTVRLLSSELDKQYRLVAAQGSRRIGDRRVSLYRFRHNLFQAYLYDSLDPVQRAYLHERLGLELEQLYATDTEAVALKLARHFQEAGIPEKAIDYLLQAGKQAIRLSAHAEAISHLNKGLALLSEMPDTPERAQWELALRLALGVPLQVTKGPGATQVGDCYLRARELYRQVGKPSQLFPAMWGLWRYYRSRAEFQTARELAEELLDLTQKHGNPALVLQGLHAQWTTLIYLGEFEAALDHIEQGIVIYSPQQHHSDASLFSGHDLGVCGHTMAAFALWMLGYPDQSLVRANQALELSQMLDHPPSMALSYEHLAGLYRFRQDFQRVKAYAEALIDLAAQQGSDYDIATGRVFLGWSLAHQGQPARGIELIRQGLAARRPPGTGLEDAHILALLAEALGQAAQISEGLQVVDGLLRMVAETRQCFWEAELHRLRGNYLLALGTPAADVEGALNQAVAVARRQNARSLVLRAALDLGRLWRDQGQVERAQLMISEVYQTFSEGFDMPDLRAAERFLETTLPGDRPV